MTSVKFVLTQEETATGFLYDTLVQEYFKSEIARVSDNQLTFLN